MDLVRLYLSLALLWLTIYWARFHMNLKVPKLLLTGTHTELVRHPNPHPLQSSNGKGSIWVKVFHVSTWRLSPYESKVLYFLLNKTKTKPWYKAYVCMQKCIVCKGTYKSQIMNIYMSKVTNIKIKENKTEYRTN